MIPKKNPELNLMKTTKKSNSISLKTVIVVIREPANILRSTVEDKNTIELLTLTSLTILKVLTNFLNEIRTKAFTSVNPIALRVDERIDSSRNICLEINVAEKIPNIT